MGADHLSVKHAIGQIQTGVVLLCDLLHHRQTQARALGLGRDVRLEGPLEHGFGKASAMIKHHHAHTPGWLQPLGAHHDRLYLGLLQLG